MQLIYEQMLGGDGGEDTLRGLIELPPNDADDAYVARVVKGVAEHADEFDALVARFSKERALERIAKVDLAILRVALLEMLYDDDMPQSVAINEAVELANRFGMPADSRFINGVLGSISKERQAQA